MVSSCILVSSCGGTIYVCQSCTCAVACRLLIIILAMFTLAGWRWVGEGTECLGTGVQQALLPHCCCCGCHSPALCHVCTVVLGWGRIYYIFLATVVSTNWDLGSIIQTPSLCAASCACFVACLLVPACWWAESACGSVQGVWKAVDLPLQASSWRDD